VSKYQALLIEKSESGFTRKIVERDTAELPEGDVLIDVRYSSLNYKDGLSATGNPGVTRTFPHTPGIDAAGLVIESAAPQFKPGDQVSQTFLVKSKRRAITRTNKPFLDLDLSADDRPIFDSLVHPGTAVSDFHNTAWWMKARLL